MIMNLYISQNFDFTNLLTPALSLFNIHSNFYQ